MLPTSPRPLERSTSSSCTTPALITATRVSRGVTLMRISSAIGVSAARRLQPVEQLPRLKKRQPHHAGVAAVKLGHEARRAALDGIGARLVVALPGRGVLRDLLRRKLLEAHFRARERSLDPLVLL